MPASRSLNITLPDDVARIVERKIASGAYQSESDVLREGVLALEEREAGVEAWLRDEVGPTYDRVVSGEEKLIPINDVFSGLKDRHEARKAARRR